MTIVCKAMFQKQLFLARTWEHPKLLKFAT